MYILIYLLIFLVDKPTTPTNSCNCLYTQMFIQRGPCKILFCGDKAANCTLIMSIYLCMSSIRIFIIHNGTVYYPYLVAVHLLTWNYRIIKNAIFFTWHYTRLISLTFIYSIMIYMSSLMCELRSCVQSLLGEPSQWPKVKNIVAAVSVHNTYWH